MFLSMTGYGMSTVDLKLKNGHVTTISIELKSLNSRFFELTTRLSRSLNFLDTDLHSILRKKIIRGRIYCSIQPTGGEGDFGGIAPSFEVAKAYLDGAKQIQSQNNISGEISIGDILSMPHLFDSVKAEISDANKKAIFKSLDEAIEKLTERRMLEGKYLKKDIESRVDVCSKSLKKISVVYEKLMDAQKKTIVSVSKLAESGNEEARLKLEDLYTALNKIDIHEEITRFESHLSILGELVASNQVEKGKRLDFTLQELVRETNTMAAKCSNAKISELAVDIKVELEKIREQTQNVL